MPGYGLIDRMDRALQQRRREDALRLKVLRAQIAAGADELERGDFVEVDAQDLEAYLQRLTAGATTDLR
jgi:antitoxin ParD1/3/4